MRKVIIYTAIALFFLAGLGVLLYPYVADYFNSRNQSRVVGGYYKEIENINDEDLSHIIDAANAYNAALPNNLDRFKTTEDQTAVYNNLMSYHGSQIMGILEIKNINVKLPIYHGTTEGVLQVGLGHMEGSSLPVGGPGTHTVITGHRGVPSATLLTHLDKIVIGDTFTLQILKEVLTYKVDQIIVTEPENMDSLVIEEGRDYCTLVTCTPYGINSHRLLVRGSRVENAEDPGDPQKLPVTIQADARQYGTGMILLAVTGSALAIAVVFGTVNYLFFIKSEFKKEGGKNRR